MSATFLFPGQGSQKAGMGADLYREFAVAKARFDAANAVLGRDIASLCFNGPEEDLKATQNTQPALFTIEAAITDVLREKGIVPTLTAGHSLGEYSALYAAGAVSFEDGLKLVARRGELMAAAGKKRPGAMAAIMGLPVEKIREVLAKVTKGIVVPANQNTPEQTVISGEVEAVNEACELLKQAGAKRAVSLPVSGAFHSPLMKEAADEYKGVLAGVTFNAPRCPVVSNVTAQPETDPKRMRDLLYEQLINPVRWVESVAAIKAAAQGRCVEAGPGSVLKNLVKACADDVNVLSCGTVENVYSVVAPA